MKTVPTVRLADTADAVVLPELPEEISWRWLISPAPRGRGCWR